MCATIAASKIAAVGAHHSVYSGLMPYDSRSGATAMPKMA
jgi:hypothetical protein